MKKLGSLSNIIVFGAIGLLVLFVIMYFMNGNEGGAAAANLSEETSQQIALSQQIERELLAELLQLQEINLDDSLFNDPAFQSLVDFSRPIQAQPIGRENPFAPITDLPGIQRRGANDEPAAGAGQ